MRKSDEAKSDAIDSRTLIMPETDQDIIHGFNQLGYYTLGSAAASWFSKEVLVKNFHDFKFKRVQSFPEQINYITEKLHQNLNNRPFFAFMNLIETHSPYMHYGNDRDEYGIKARGEMKFPPIED